MCDDTTPEEVFAALVKTGLVLPFIHDGELSFPLFPYEEGVLPFPFRPGKGGLPLPFPLLLSKARRDLGCWGL